MPEENTLLRIMRSALKFLSSKNPEQPQVLTSRASGETGSPVAKRRGQDDEEKVLLEATVCFPRHAGRVLLARKQKKIGAGCWNGYGGGLEEGESVVDAAIRELFEESGVTALHADLEKVAVIDFHNTKSDGSVFVCRVHFFMVARWSGVPTETDEMAEPTWFETWNVPRQEMMPADKIFFPLLLAGKKLVGTVHYGPFQKVMTQDPVFTEVIDLSEG